MCERDVLINTAAIIAKDIMADTVNSAIQLNLLQQTTGAQNYRSCDVPSFPLLESDSDDEAFSFFLKQQNFLNPAKKTSIEKVNKKRTIPKPSNEVIVEEQHQKRSHLDVIERPRINPILELNLLNEFDSSSFESYLHMSKATFLKIFKTMSHILTRITFSNEQTLIVPPQTVFSLALWKLTTDEHFEEISRRFHIPLHTCHMAIRKFWRIISENYECFIKWPNSHRSQKSTLSNFRNIPELKVFQQLFGIISTKQLDIFLESEDEEVSVILQIICNAEEKIIDCFVEFSSEYSFDCSPIGQTLDLNSQTIPAGSYIIGDRSFPLRHFLIRPFEIECFRQETSFNNMLMPAIALGERVLNAMSERFHTLYALEAKDITEVRKIIETVSSLHNLCVDLEDKYVCSGTHAATDNSATELKTKLAASGSKGSEKNQQGIEARLNLMERVMQ